MALCAWEGYYDVFWYWYICGCGVFVYEVQVNKSIKNSLTKLIGEAHLHSMESVLSLAGDLPASTYIRVVYSD